MLVQTISKKIVSVIDTIFFSCGQILCLSLCISYHGLGVWFPDMIKYMQYEEYESKVKVFHRERVEHFHFNFSLVNQIHREGEYVHDK